MAATQSKNGKIGVIATKATVASKAYDRAIAKINPQAQVISQACPLLVPLVENGRFQAGDPVTQLVVREYLDPMVEQGIDTLIALTAANEEAQRFYRSVPGSVMRDTGIWIDIH